MDTTVSAQAVVTDGIAVCEVSYVDPDAVKVMIGNEESPVLSVEYNDNGSYSIFAQTELPDGTYDATVTVESIKPFSLIFQ